MQRASSDHFRVPIDDPEGGPRDSCSGTLELDEFAWIPPDVTATPLPQHFEIPHCLRRLSLSRDVSGYSLLSPHVLNVVPPGRPYGGFYTIVVDCCNGQCFDAGIGHSQTELPRYAVLPRTPANAHPFNFSSASLRRVRPSRNGLRQLFAVTPESFQYQDVALVLPFLTMGLLRARRSLVERLHSQLPFFPQDL